MRTKDVNAAPVAMKPPPSSISREPSADVVARALEGDGDARQELVRQCRLPCYLLALQLLGNREDARDVAQEAMLRFFAHLSRFDPSRPVLPWLRRIVRNRVVDLQRRGRVRRAESLETSGPHGGAMQLRAMTLDPLQQAERRERHQRVWRAVQDLPPFHREIVVLRDYQDLAYREIAEVLDIPLGTVMSRLHAARLRLRCLLAPVGDGSGGGLR